MASLSACAQEMRPAACEKSLLWPLGAEGTVLSTSGDLFGARAGLQRHLRCELGSSSLRRVVS